MSNKNDFNLDILLATGTGLTAVGALTYVFNSEAPSNLAVFVTSIAAIANSILSGYNFYHAVKETDYSLSPNPRPSTCANLNPRFDLSFGTIGATYAAMGLVFAFNAEAPSKLATFAAAIAFTPLAGLSAHSFYRVFKNADYTLGSPSKPAAAKPKPATPKGLG